MALYVWNTFLNTTIFDSIFRVCLLFRFTKPLRFILFRIVVYSIVRVVYTSYVNTELRKVLKMFHKTIGYAITEEEVFKKGFNYI